MHGSGSDPDPFFHFPLRADGVEDKYHGDECDEDGHGRSEAEIKRPGILGAASGTPHGIRI